jgi:DNA-binding GntR family transcriptional regulator
MPIEPKSLQTRSAYRQMRRQLLHGQLNAGSRMVEEKWAASLGVNRSAVREALLLLAHDGLLENGERGGFFVPEIDRTVLDDTLEVRLALELGAIDILEIRGEVPTDGLEKLRETVDLMQQLMEAGFEYGFFEADRRCHEILVEMAGNPRLQRIYQQAPLPLSPMEEPDEAARRRNMEGTFAEHREFCRLLEENRLAELRKLLRLHLLRDHRGSRQPARDHSPQDEPVSAVEA